MSITAIRASMNVLTGRTLTFAALIVGGIAMAALMIGSISGIARIMHGSPARAEGSRGNLAPYHAAAASSKAVSATEPMATQQREVKGRGKAKCRECGLIVSMREVEGNAGDFGAVATAVSTMQTGNSSESRVSSPKRYRITVRMADGSSRVIDHANPASWRPGERVILIDGAKPASARKLR